MRKLWLDFETRSYVDLKDSGLDRYAKDITTEVLMLAWAFDDDQVQLWEPRLGPMPEELKAGLLNPDVLKVAWNYNFEKDIMEFRCGIAIPQNQWFDPNVLCANMSLPIGLDRAAQALNIDIELKKTVITGKTKPVKMFSEPTKATKTMMKKNPDQQQFYYKDWNSHPDKWTEFCEYCKQDVVAERAVWYAAVAMNCPITPGEIQAWLLDQRMNAHGVWIDQVYVGHAKKFAEENVAGLLTELKTITGCDNPNSGPQLLKWLQERGYESNSVDKENIANAIAGKLHGSSKLSVEVKQVLDLKQKLGGSAYKKLQTIEDRIGHDGRLRSQFVYHGAHTARWSGRGVQLQNLFKPDKRVSMVLDPVVQAIRNNALDIAAIVSEYNQKVAAHNILNPDKKKPELKSFSVMDAVAGTIRASFAATPGNKLTVGDLAQIESRVLAALAGCQAMIDAYANGLDLYKDIMAFLLNKPYDEITSQERANGKVIILGCGFGMGWEKFIDYAATFGVTLNKETAKLYVNAFREKYAEIPAFWKALNAAVVKAVKLNVCVFVKGLVIDGRNPEMLKIKLPSQRCLHYLRPRITMEKTDWGEVREGVAYESWDAKGCQDKRLYGGLLCENVVQAVARDILLNGMLVAESKGFIIIMTIHDEIVCESPKNGPLGEKDLLDSMRMCPDWGEGMGFVLAAEGYECDYYKK